MLRQKRDTFPRKLRKRFKRYVPNEVVVKSVPEVRNDNLPHYLNVITGVLPQASSFGDDSIDAALQRLNVNVQSIARVFTPKSVPKNLPAAEGARALAHSRIAADYDDKEHTYGLSRTYRIRFEHNIKDIDQLCTELRKSAAIEQARPNYVSEVFARPDDDFFGEQWGLQALECESGWDVTTGHPDVLIAIVDSGIDLKHEDLKGQLKQGFDFVDYGGWAWPWPFLALGDYSERDDNPNDEDGHGTHCAGIAAAVSDNGTGVAGVCWQSGILPVRVMFRAYVWLGGYETSVGTDTDIDAGIKFAVDSGANVINLSLGGSEPSHEEVLRYAYDKNVCVIAATGNENSHDPSYPAANKNVLAVGAVDQSLNRASFSNYGPSYNQFVMAPGTDILSTYKENSYELLNGTSMATPFVSGLAALIIGDAKSKGKKLSIDEVYEIIRKTATPLGTGKGDKFYGEGLVNVTKALETVRLETLC